MEYPASVFEAIVRPSTWGGNDHDARVGLFYTYLAAEQAAEDWKAAHPYWYAIGEWEVEISPIPVG